MAEQYIQIPRNVMWSVLAGLLSLVGWLAWANIEYRLDQLNTKDCDQDRIIIANQEAIKNLLIQVAAQNERTGTKGR